MAAAGAWASSDGQVYVEHGHQIGWRADRFADWPAPFIERAGRRHLERPWGARTAGALLREHEQRYPVVDNFADLGAGLTRALAAAGTTDLGAAAADLVRYVLFRMPWQQFRVDLDVGDVQPPAWDLAAVRGQGPAFLADSLPDDDPFEPLARQALEAGSLAALMDALDNDELTALCDYRAALRRARRRFERYLTQTDPLGPPVAECPRLPDSRGGQFDYFWRTRDLIYGRRLETVQASLPDAERPIAVFVHGHTQLVDWRQRVLLSTSQGRPVIVDGFSPVRNALTPVVINGGAWQRTITPSSSPGCGTRTASRTPSSCTRCARSTSRPATASSGSNPMSGRPPRRSSATGGRRRAAPGSSPPNAAGRPSCRHAAATPP